MTASDAPQGENPSDDRERLRSHFSVPQEQHGTRWSDLWDKGDFLPWDRQRPNPALEDILVQRRQELKLPARDSTTPDHQRKKALVPGCGRGYDVLLFALHGIDAYGLEISSTAVEQARSYTSSKIQELATAPDGNVQFFNGDFYKEDWLQECRLGSNKEFDFVYDYTFLCAMQPALRPAWADRMANLVARSTGILICVEFPLYKPLETGGPPWGLKSQVYDELLSGGFEKVSHFKPERTHKIGEGTDWVSIWRRK